MKRILVAGAGATVTLVGLAGLALPILPGWLLIFAGLAILGGEFVWARRLLDGAKAKATDVVGKARGRQEA